ncbi:hypothetical protein MIND_00756900 [Mycena indigotica]|uniref:Uncharacterized protein n=1 Tax=Mycena indigotica TaxID=2126181 RepID=A0A8H6SM83_9AGAR|nr:uncharacterized protein MIND_00756900 [Mycena indigotica]KAF7301909.1 hypothetical protein MIND_00756900 [Mycena indigotica]
MGNSGSGPDEQQPMSFTSRLNGDSPPFQPRFTRTDTTTVEVGSPRPDIADQSVSNKSANNSLPLSDSVIPATFETSEDLSTNQLSHFFPFPPGETSIPHPAQNNMMTSLNDNMERVSLQEALDAVWAPSKRNPVRISALPPQDTPVQEDLEPLIDLSSDIPSLPSFPTTSSMATITALSIDSDTSLEQVRFEPVASSPKPSHDDPQNKPYEFGSILVEDGEAIPPPTTYADATNVGDIFSFCFPASNVLFLKIANKYPELASKVLKQPLASPSTSPHPSRRELDPDETDHSKFNISVHVERVVVRQSSMPPHTPDRPNWAVAPDEKPSYRQPGRHSGRPRRDSGVSQHGSSAHMPMDKPDSRWTFNDNSNFERNGSIGGNEDNRAHNPSPHLSHVHPSRARNLAGPSDGPPYPENSAVDTRVTSQATRYDLQSNESRTNSPQQKALDGRQSSPRAQETLTPPRNHSPASHWQSRSPSRDGSKVTQSPQKRHELLPSLNQSPARSQYRLAWTPTHDGWADQSPPKIHNSLPSGNQSPSRYRLSESATAHGPRRSNPASPVRQEHLNHWTTSHDPWADDRRSTHRERGTHDGRSHNNNSSWSNDNSENPDRRLPKPEQKGYPERRRNSPSPFHDRINHSYDSYSRDRPGSVPDHSFGGSGDVLEAHRVPAQSSIAALAAARATGQDSGLLDHQNGNNAASYSEFDYFAHSDGMNWTDSSPAALHTNIYSPSQRIASPSHALPEDNESRSEFDSRHNPFDLGQMKADTYDHSQRQGSRDEGATRWGPDERFGEPRQHQRENHYHNTAERNNWDDDHNGNERDKWGLLSTSRDQWGLSSSSNQRGAYNDREDGNQDQRREQDKWGGHQHHEREYTDHRGNDNFRSWTSSAHSGDSSYRRRNALPSQAEEFNRYCDARGFNRNRDRFAGAGARASHVKFLTLMSQEQQTIPIPALGAFTAFTIDPVLSLDPDTRNDPKAVAACQNLVSKPYVGLM